MDVCYHVYRAALIYQGVDPVLRARWAVKVKFMEQLRDRSVASAAERGNYDRVRTAERLMLREAYAQARALLLAEREEADFASRATLDRIKVLMEIGTSYMGDRSLPLDARVGRAASFYKQAYHLALLDRSVDPAVRGLSQLLHGTNLVLRKQVEGVGLLTALDRDGLNPDSSEGRALTTTLAQGCLDMRQWECADTYGRRDLMNKRWDGSIDNLPYAAAAERLARGYAEQRNDAAARTMHRRFAAAIVGWMAKEGRFDDAQRAKMTDVRPVFARSVGVLWRLAAR